MSEVEKLKRAKLYLESLARGVDPISSQEVEDDSVLNNVRLSRCFFYVSEILQQVIDNGGTVGRKAYAKKMPFAITEAQKQNVELSEDAVSVSIIAERINTAVADEEIAKLSAVKITSWLAADGYLDEITREHGGKQKVASEKAKTIGIASEERTSTTRGSYILNLYSRTAQQFVIDNIEKIITYKPQKDDNQEEPPIIEGAMVHEPNH